MNGQEVALELGDLSFRYGPKHVLDHVSLAVRAGGVVALLGRNGAGKSTLMRLVLGQLKPRFGSIRVFGMDAWRERRNVLRRVAFVPEAPDLPPSLRVSEAVKLCASLFPEWDSEALDARLERAHVAQKSRVGSLSRGQQKILPFALALARRPELLVLDDPTSALDPLARDEVWETLVEELADRGTTTLLATHDVPGAERIADRVAILKGGCIVLDEPSDALADRCRCVVLGVPPDKVSALETVLEAFGPLSRRTDGRVWEVLLYRCDPALLSPALAELGVEQIEAWPLGLHDLFVALHA
jgi:ABC-2 type transport system ATP-binding protein